METPHEPAIHADRVPDELMQRLHEANVRFHQGRERLEATSAGSEYRHEKRVEAAMDELRQAEREVEEVEEQIRKVFTPHTPPDA
jgi:hypothetical protein